MSVEDMKALVRRLIAERNKGKTPRIDVMDEIFATDFVGHNARGEVIQGLQGLKQRISESYERYPDQHVTIEDMIAEGDKVVVRWTWTGTQKATNKTVTVWGIGISRIANGKIVERWERSDTLGTAQQLGLAPTPKEE